jgi:hypothetical protein
VTCPLKAGIVYSVETGQEQIDDEITIGLEELKATGLEANPEETEAAAEHQGVPNKEAVMEIIGAPV